MIMKVVPLPMYFGLSPLHLLCLQLKQRVLLIA